MKIIATALLIASFLPAAGGTQFAMNDVSWSWVPVDASIISIPIDTAIDIAVITDFDGLEAFNLQYGTAVTPDPDLFLSNVVVAVFTHIWMGIDGVARSRTDEYCISIFDTGIDIEMTEPPPGKRYVTIHPISLPASIVDGRIHTRQPQPAIRSDFGIRDGLNKLNIPMSGQVKTQNIRPGGWEKVMSQ